MKIKQVEYYELLYKGTNDYEIRISKVLINLDTVSRVFPPFYDDFYKAKVFRIDFTDGNRTVNVLQKYFKLFKIKR